MNKLCKDCKHFVKDTVSWDTPVFQQKYAVCALTSKVTGVDGELCWDRRNRFFDGCGPKGKLWEAKP